MAAPRLVAKHNLWDNPKTQKPGPLRFLGLASSAVQYDRYHQAGGTVGAAAASTPVVEAEIEILEVALGLAVVGIGMAVA